MTLQKHLVYTHFLFEEMVPERGLQKAQLFLSAVLDVTNVVEMFQVIGGFFRGYKLDSFQY